MNTLLTAPDIEYLRGQQMKLDEEIIEKNKITHDEWMVDYNTKHFLATRVEIHEFINECYDQFKYWKKKPINKGRIIDEAVDVLHFVCLGWNKSSKTNEDIESELRAAMRSFDNTSTVDKLAYLSGGEDVTITPALALVLLVLNDYNFTTSDILDAYNRKNKENFRRLESGY